MAPLALYDEIRVNLGLRVYGQRVLIVEGGPHRMVKMLGRTPEQLD